MYPLSYMPYAFNHQSKKNFINNYGYIQNQNRYEKPIEKKYIKPSNLFPNYKLNRNRSIFASSNNISILNNATIPRNIERSSRKRTLRSPKPIGSNKTQYYSQRATSQNQTVKRFAPLSNSQSVGVLESRIGKERRSHTMAPLSRILGPCATPKAKLFATTIAPTDAQTIKSNQIKQDDISDIQSIYNTKSDVDFINNYYDDDDEGPPIIVKVQYDPQNDPPPDEDFIRQAVNDQLDQLPNNINHQEPIVFNFIGRNIKPDLSVRVQQQQQQHDQQEQHLNQQIFNETSQSIEQRPSLRIPILSEEKHEEIHKRNVFLPSNVVQSSKIEPSTSSIYHQSHSYLKNDNINSVEYSKSIINHQDVQSNKMQQIPYKNLISSQDNNQFYRKEFENSKRKNRKMAGYQPVINEQDILSRLSYSSPLSNEIYRPSALTDTPELSRENLLNMLNQIPDLQGRRFNIEYAAGGAPQGYPIPVHLASAATSYPEPVYTDRLPNDILQHIRSSNNTALTAALEATIQRDQYIQSSGLSQPAPSTVYYQPTTVMQYPAQPNQQVQQSRPLSSKASNTNTERSSSRSSYSSSSEETDCEELQNISSPMNSIPTVGPYSANSFTQTQYRNN
ncbi:unnamed protein product [Rotaria sp. Silwood1]|nr:unnamed protein product [Rotaria sp. Silwood1]